MKKGKMVIRTRQVGDVFLWKKQRFEVVESESGCLGCGMYELLEPGCVADIEVCGLCYKGMRSDNKSVVFRKVTD